MNNFFHIDIQALSARIQTFKSSTPEKLAAIIATPHKEVTFENTFGVFDQIKYDYDFLFNQLDLILHVYHVSMHDWAVDEKNNLTNFAVDAIHSNREIHQYLLSVIKPEWEQKYYLEKFRHEAQSKGFELDDASFELAKELDKKICRLSTTFDKNISDDSPKISVELNALRTSGMSDDFIDSVLAQPENSASATTVSLGVDYPTYFAIMDKCTDQEIRRRLYVTINQRAAPMNESVLDELLKLRHQYAQLVGYKNYASLSLSSQMMGSQERVQTFLNQLKSSGRARLAKDIEDLKNIAPPGLDLNPIAPWNISFLINQYKNKYLNLDNDKVSEYFPMEKTIQGLYDIYSRFFGLTFETVDTTDWTLWHPEAEVIKVSNKDRTLGYIGLDLHPRDNKYTHACCIGLRSQVRDTDCPSGQITPAVSIVVCNFPKPTETKPSLLKFNDVVTFFHEFGHAIHQTLGYSQRPTESGYNCVLDFVELPSQLLELWLYEKPILELIGCHYQTGEKLPDELVESLQKTKTLMAGYLLTRQLYLSQVSLSFHTEAYQGNLESLHDKIFTDYFDGFVVCLPENKMYTSFTHLTGYDAKYYNYKITEVYACDIFQHIKNPFPGLYYGPNGLLDSNVGKKYMECILCPGGSRDPMKMMRDFLGRNVSEKPYYAEYGFT